MRSAARHDGFLRLFSRGNGVRWTGRAFVASCCVAALGFGSCQAADPVEPESGDAVAAGGHSWSLRLPGDGKVAFRGALDDGGASVGSPSMLYPAPNAAGFIAAVITHGLIVESQKNTQRKKAQENADRVLDPYRSLLDVITYEELARAWGERMPQEGARKLIGPSEAPAIGGWLIEAKPVFTMAQDQRTLRLDAAITIRAPDAADSAASQHHILVISPAVGSESPTEAWTAGEGKALREASAWLFAESVDIAMGAAAGDGDVADRPFRTIRYLEGRTEKMERAQLISEQCGRAIIKTLRGALMSVQLKAPTPGASGAQASCAQG